MPPLGERVHARGGRVTACAPDRRGRQGAVDVRRAHAVRRAPADVPTTSPVVTPLPALTRTLRPAAVSGLAVSTSGLVVRRTFANYQHGYDTAYPREFWEGFGQGLDELVEQKIIKQSAVAQIEANHPMAVTYPPG